MDHLGMRFTLIKILFDFIVGWIFFQKNPPDNKIEKYPHQVFDTTFMGHELRKNNSST